MQNQITFHEIESEDLFSMNATRAQGGQLEFGLPAEVIQMMHGAVIHIHESKESPSHSAFICGPHPEEIHAVLIEPAHSKAGDKCQTWLYQADRPYVGVSNYTSSQLLSIAGGLIWNDGVHSNDLFIRKLIAANQ
jgi:hypothetical protein